MNRQCFTIFIASPGDLFEERKLARDVCQRINKIVGKSIFWHVDLMGWEDTLPGANRPQAIINEDIKECDLFIGMIWKHWGQETGKYSSGFHEEFQLAKELHDKKSKPEMWLFFKDIKENELTDPGPQLNKVIEFKREIESSKEFLYKTFTSENGFKDLLYDSLLQYIIQLNKDKSDFSTVKTEEEIETEDPRLKRDDIYSKDVVNILSLAEEDKLLNLINMNRINLFTTLVISYYQSNITLDNHVINRVYKNRLKYELSKSEIQGLLPYIIENEYHPGWYWLRNTNVRTLYKYLRLITIEGTKNQRKAAIKFFTKYSIKLITMDNYKDYFDEDILEEVIDNINSQDLKEKLIEIFGGTTNSTIKQKIQILEYDCLGCHEDSIEFLKINILANKLLRDKISEIDIDNISHEIILEIINDIPQLNAKKIISRILHSSLYSEKEIHDLFKKIKNTDFKNQIIEYALKKDLTKLLEDEIKSDKVNIIFKIKYYKDRKFYYNVKDPNSIDIYDVEAYRIYNIINYAKTCMLITEYLDNNFSKYRKILEKEYLLASANGVISDKDIGLIEFIISEMIVASLYVLWYKQESIGLKYARKYYNNTKYGLADTISVSLISQYGDDSDFKILKKYCEKNSDDLRLEISEKIMSISPTIQTSLFLLNIGDEKLIDHTIKLILKKKIIFSDNDLLDLLHSKSDVIRNASIKLILLFEKPMNIILDNYILSGNYYYNSVKKMDTLLYAPKKVCEKLKEELLKSI